MRHALLEMLTKHHVNWLSAHMGAWRKPLQLVGVLSFDVLTIIYIKYVLINYVFFSVKPGVRFREIGEIVNRHATMSGLSVVKSSSFFLCVYDRTCS